MVSEKREARQRARTWLRTLPAQERRDRSRDVCARLSEIVNARCVMAYAPLGDEVDVWPWVRHLCAAGVEVVLPRVADEALVLHSVTRPDDQVVSGAYGIREPRRDQPMRTAERVGAVVVPALGIDPDGARLGRGKGYYDRFLSDVSGNVLRVGVVFEEQLLESRIGEPHDARMDVVVTARRTWWLSEERD